MRSKNPEIEGWQRILLLIIPYIFIVGLFQFIGMLIIGVDYKNPNLTSQQHLAISIFNLIGTFLVVWLFTKFVDKDKFINLGFKIKSRFKEICYGILIGAIIMLLGYGLLILANEITFDKIIVNYKEIIMSITFFGIVAIVEETLIRGYVLKNLMISFNKYVALIVSSLLFASMHLANPNMSLFNFFSLFLAGIFLGISYIFTKNLWFPIALHFSWNLSQTFLGFNVSGQDIYSIVEFEITNNNNYINGGNFGFEGSIFSTIFQIICIILIHNYYGKIEINN